MSEIGKLAGLLSALRPFRDTWSGINNVDGVCQLLERRLDKACKELMDGQEPSE